MPRLMERNDWARTISGFGIHDRVWQTDLPGSAKDVSFSLPESGPYRVFFVKVDGSEHHCYNAHSMVGYARKYGGGPRTQQRYLWNGKVDIVVTISGEESDVAQSGFRTSRCQS